MQYDTKTSSRHLMNGPGTRSAENHIEALKSLATLLLREVESLQRVPGRVAAGNGIDSSEESRNLDLSAEIQQFEIDLIRQAMIRAKGSQRRAAAILGTKASTLNSKIKRYGLEDFITLGKL